MSRWDIVKTEIDLISKVWYWVWCSFDFLHFISDDESSDEDDDEDDDEYEDDEEQVHCCLSIYLVHFIK